MTINDAQTIAWQVRHRRTSPIIGVQGMAGNDQITVNFGTWAGMMVYVTAATATTDRRLDPGSPRDRPGRLR